MAHKILVKDDLTGGCGFADPLCPSTMTDNGDGTYTYTPSTGPAVIIDTANLESVVTQVVTSGNVIANHTTDNGVSVSILETVTDLSYDSNTTSLSYVDEAGNTTVVDLSALTSDIFVNGGSFNPSNGILTLTDNDGGTADIVVDLSMFTSTFIVNPDNSITHTDGSGSITNYDEIETTLTQAADGSFTYTNESGTTTTIDICSMTAGLPDVGPLQCV